MPNCRVANQPERSLPTRKPLRPRRSSSHRRHLKRGLSPIPSATMKKLKRPDDSNAHEIIVVGGGIAGLSAAIYLGRAQRDVVVIDSGHSMAKWEPVVQNYLGFPKGVGGEELLKNGGTQAQRYEACLVRDEIKNVSARKSIFVLKGKRKTYRTKRLLIATGIFHLPPEIPGVKECLGHSMFFCKDCDGYRVRGKRIAIIGANNETVEYALGMLDYSACVIVATNGKRAHWDKKHAGWLEEYEIPIARN